MPLRKAKALLSREELNFLIKFLLIFFLLFALLKTINISPLILFIANFEYGLLRYLGIPAELDGTRILLDTSTIQFVPECSGLVMVILLAALLWSTRLPNERRIKYLLLSIPFFLAFNLFRLFVTLLPLAYAPSLFDITHIILWFVDSALVLYIWMRAQNIPLSSLLKSRKHAFKAK